PSVESLALSGQQPVGVGPRLFDQAQEDVGGKGDAALVIRPGPLRDAQGLGQGRYPVIPVSLLADLAEAAGEHPIAYWIDGGFFLSGLGAVIKPDSTSPFKAITSN